MRFSVRSTSVATVHFKNHLSSSSHPSQTNQIFSQTISSASSSCHLFEAKQDHASMVKQGTYNSLFLQNKQLQAYTKSREFDDADNLFDEMPLRNTVTWNIMVHGIIQRDGNINQKAHLGFCHLSQILLSEVSLDHVTFIGLIRLCTDSIHVEAGVQLHCLIVKQGLESNRFLSTTLVDFYGKCNHIVEARRVFDTVLSKDSVLCNALVSSYVLNGMINEAFGLLTGKTGFRGDNFTFSSLLSACMIEQGKIIHAIVIKLSYRFDVPVATALVNMYAKNGGEHMRDARKCFESMVSRNVVSWNAMIVGYGQNGEGREARRLFVRMVYENLKPDELTFASVLSSCAKASAVREITQVQGFVTKSGYVGFLSVANSLINAYSKNGGLSESVLCFDSIKEPDLVSWTSIIGALAFHGSAEESLRKFETMLRKKIHQPDKIIFLEILTACSHGGLVQEGIHYFKQMIEVYKLRPNAEHYVCLIDLLGRAGFICEAFDVLTSMPLSKDALAAFTGACNIHEKRGEIMKQSAKKLLEIEPYKSVNYSVLSNAYVSEGHWNQAALLRKTERRNCNNNPKTPGCSWIGD